MSKITDQLRSFEKILWQGKPEPKKLRYSSYYLVFLLVGILFMVLSLIILIPITILNDFSTTSVLFTLAFFIIGLVSTIGALFSSTRASKNTEYLVTDQRIIIKPGVWGNDFRIINFYEAGEVKVESFDGRTGNIFVENPRPIVIGYSQFLGETKSIIGPDIRAIKEPYEVQKIIQSAIQDYKSKSQKKS